jgi:NhaP-type Na+/H+ or K+/H+ antiporter
LTVTIPLVVLVAVTAFIAWRFMGLRVWQLILCLLLGFLLAATSAALEINQIVVGVVHALTGH